MLRDSLREKYDLNLKVDRFVKEYSRRIKGHYTDIGEYEIPSELREYIEAKAVYVELRRPIVSGGVDREWAQTKNSEAKERFKWEFFDLANQKGFPFAEDEEIDLMTLYRVIERGKGGINIDRAIGFAQERELDVTIPVRYGAFQHLTSEELLSFMPPLKFSSVCPKFYLIRNSDSFRGVGEITVREIFEDRVSFDRVAKKAVATL